MWRQREPCVWSNDDESMLKKQMMTFHFQLLLMLMLMDLWMMLVGRDDCVRAILMKMDVEAEAEEGWLRHAAAGVVTRDWLAMMACPASIVRVYVRTKRNETEPSWAIQPQIERTNPILFSITFQLCLQRESSMAYKKIILITRMKKLSERAKISPYIGWWCSNQGQADIDSANHLLGCVRSTATIIARIAIANG